MSIEEQDAIVGRLIRQRSEAAKQIALTGAELERISELFRAIAEALRLFGVKKPNQQVEEDLRSVDLNRILALMTECRTAIVQRDQAIEKLQQLGINV